jgi:hypothetical protein
MKKTLMFGTLLLGCCLAAVAQTGSTPNQTPPASTPSTFPQDQTGQTPANPATPAAPSAIPPDTSATGMARDHAKASASEPSDSPVADLEGCLSQSSDGAFMLVDKSGNSFQLHGDRSKFNSYLGKQVRVDGIAGSSNPGAMSGSSAGAATAFNVSDIHKVSDACATSTSK